jgi:hypothetical protein
VSVNASMSVARLGLEADDLLMGIITLRPPEDSDDDWKCFCSDPPEPKVTRGRTGKEAMVRLIRWVAARRKVYR